MNKNIKIENLNELSRKIGLPNYILTPYIFNASKFYRNFKISKRSKRGYRKISSPSRRLKGIQRWIATFILSRVTISEVATGYRKGLSIKTNALIHANHDFVCNLDIQDFFPSISAKRITGIYKGLGYPKDVAFFLTRLTTLNNQLPQGAPSSPALSNIILRHLDLRIKNFCDKRSWFYSRYCDDLTISGAGGISPNELEKLYQIVKEEGFQVNKRKTRIQRKCSRQIVTGLVVNRGVSIPVEKRKTIRAIFHQASLYPEKFKDRFQELNGYLGYIKFLRPDDHKTNERYQNILYKLKGIDNTSEKLQIQAVMSHENLQNLNHELLPPDITDERKTH